MVKHVGFDQVDVKRSIFTFGPQAASQRSYTDLIAHDSSTQETRTRITSVLVFGLRTSSLAAGNFLRLFHTCPDLKVLHTCLFTRAANGTVRKGSGRSQTFSPPLSAFLSLKVLDKIAHKHPKVLLFHTRCHVILGSATGASWEPEKTELFLLFPPLWSFPPVVVITRLFWEFWPKRIRPSGRRRRLQSESRRPSA